MTRDASQQPLSSSAARFYHQSSQILPCPFPGDDAYQRLDRHPQWPSEAYSREDSGYQFGVSQPPGGCFRFCRMPSEHGWTDGIL